jgi:hypothetical protein
VPSLRSSPSELLTKIVRVSLLGVMSVQPSALIVTERWVRGSSGSSGCVMRITLSVKGGARPTIGHRDERVAFL